MLLAGLSTVSPLATDMYLPAFPEIASRLGTSPQAVQLTLTAYLVPLALGQLLFGTLSDGHGRRPFVVGGSCLLVAGSVVAALSPSIIVLLVGRVMQGVGGAAALVSGRAMVADLLTGRRAARAFIAIGTASGLGPVLAPSLGAWLSAAFGWRAIFTTIALTQLVLLVASLGAGETLPARRRTPEPLRRLAPGLLALARSPAYRWQLLVSTSSFVALFAYISASPFVGRQLGWSTPQFTTDFAVNGAGMMAVSLLSATVVVRIGRGRVMGSGLWVSLAGAGCLWLAAHDVHRTPAVLLGFFLVCCAKGSTGGNSYSLAVSAVPGSPGLALAAMGAVQFVAAGAAAAVVGADGGSPLVPVAGVTMIASLTALVAHRRASAHRSRLDPVVSPGP